MAAKKVVLVYQCLFYETALPCCDAVADDEGGRDMASFYIPPRLFRWR